MSGPYDLVGDDDDDFGSVGALDDWDDDEDEDDILIGDEDDDDEDDDYLLDALSVSGMGDTEIVGHDDDEIGAKRRRRRRRSRRTRRAKKGSALRKILLRNAGAVLHRGVNTRRRYPLGITPDSVAAGASVQLPAAAPQSLFRPERLIIPSDIAFDFGVSDIKVGNTSQFAQSSEVPAALFSEVAIDSNVNFDTAEVGNQISIAVRNKTAGAIEFTAGFVGTVAKP